ncbi:hypothetical protein [Massilia antarctica]|uniref:hypothetical protein n=1 Tax=Massilia antarctica TaxID=2765360 RepID=UPI00226D5B50|nr:hypothetical protein [Massilia sp. H27-R4]MCY0912528.1 hypothetical protein [Massilia sp. H27-R4]
MPAACALHLDDLDHAGDALSDRRRGSAFAGAGCHAVALSIATSQRWRSISPNSLRRTMQRMSRPARYLYDRSGRFHGISYSDGRAMTAMYDESGNIQSVLENGSGQKIVFKKKATIQNG